MFTAGYSLTSNHYFEFVQKNKIVVTVWKEDTLVQVGPIESFTDLTIIIKEHDYCRETYDFKVQEVIF